jgi:hypothetical protein
VASGVVVSYMEATNRFERPRRGVVLNVDDSVVVTVLHIVTLKMCLSRKGSSRMDNGCV